MQRTILTTTVLAAVAAVALTACEPTGSTAAPAKTVTVTPTPGGAATTGPSSPKAVAEPTRTKAGPKLIRVPDVVGHNHQKAQNEMQAHGLFHLAEEDATGQGRMLLWDRNWVVVRQSPKAGTLVRADAVITLYSKKIGE